MTDMFCKKCGKWKGGDALGGHKCPPVWRCWAPDWLGQTVADAHRVHHTCSGWAAEQFVDQNEYHNCHFSVANSDEAVQVFVMLDSAWEAHLDRDPAWEPDAMHPAVEVFDVTGELVREYHAKELSKEELANE